MVLKKKKIPSFNYLSKKKKKAIELFCILFRDTVLYYLFYEIFLLTLFDNVINSTTSSTEELKKKNFLPQNLSLVKKTNPNEDLMKKLERESGRMIISLIIF